MDLHETYINMRDRVAPMCAEPRRYCEALWSIYEPLADDHFIEQFARHPEQRFWEMYLACTFADLGFAIQSSNEGPDLLVQHRDKRIWIEAIAPTPGVDQSPDRVPPIVPISEGGVASEVPVDKIKLRYTSALSEKTRKAKAYIENRLITEDDLIVVAISGAEMSSRSRGPGIPYIVRAVFPIGAPYVDFHIGTDTTESGYHSQFSVKKMSGADVPMTAFLDSAYARVSGLIFGPKGIGNTPEILGSDLITVHNPLATNPMSRGLIPRGQEWWATERGDYYETGHTIHGSG